jgi:hypothetical protein
MKMLSETREVAVWVVDTGVMMIQHSGGECDLDIRAHGDRRQAANEGVVGIVVRRKEKRRSEQRRIIM